MSAQAYLAQLMSENRAQESLHRTPVRKRGLSRHARRIRRSLEDSKR